MPVQTRAGSKKRKEAEVEQALPTQTAGPSNASYATTIVNKPIHKKARSERITVPVSKTRTNTKHTKARISRRTVKAAARANSAPGIPAKNLVTPTQQQRADADSFDRRIQALPQELQDMIFHEAVIAPIKEEMGTVIPISRSRKPPVAFQLNRKLEKSLRDAYYSSVAFQLPSFFEPGTNAAAAQAISWLMSLRRSHRRLVQAIVSEDIRSEKLMARFGLWAGLYRHSLQCADLICKDLKDSLYTKASYKGEVVCRLVGEFLDARGYRTGVPDGTMQYAQSTKDYIQAQKWSL